MTGQAPPAIPHNTKPKARASGEPSPLLLAIMPLRFLLRKLAPVAYELGYVDGWDDAIGRPRVRR